MVPTTDDIQHNICESEKLQGAAFEHQTFGLVNDFQFTNMHSRKGISPNLPRKTGSFMCLAICRSWAASETAEIIWHSTSV